MRGRTRGLGPAVLGVALGLAAGLFDAEALWIPAAGLVLLWALVAGALWVAARGARVERELGAARVVEGEPLVVRVRARAGRLRLAGGELVAMPGPHPQEAPVARLAAGRGGVAGEAALSFPRRGRVTLPPAELRLVDALGLGVRTVSGGEGDDLLVLPRVEPVRSLAAGGGLLRGGEDGAHTAPGAESEIDGLRPYREGTPATRIHWPALARGAGLVERRMLPEAERLPLVALDAGREADGDALDAAVRATASLAMALAARGGCAVLLPGDRRPTSLEPALLAWPGLHARLALVEPGPSLGLGGHAHRHRTLVLVCARAPTRAPVALTAGPRGARLLVVPGTWGSAPPVLAVAGCHGYALGATSGRLADPVREAVLS